MEIAPPYDATANPTVDVVRFWTTACNRFLRWQKEHFLERKPEPGVEKIHSHNLSMMLHMGRILYAEVADPDPKSVLAHEVSGKLSQLEQSWQMFHNPMTDAEADAILKSAFPDEPATGKAP
jgi:hypothetical protein